MAPTPGRTLQNSSVALSNATGVWLYQPYNISLSIPFNGKQEPFQTITGSETRCATVLEKDEKPPINNDSVYNVLA